MREVTLTAVGADRPGIVAAITDALADRGANLLDCRAALLRGSFAMVLAVEIPDTVSRVDLSESLERPAQDLGLRVWVDETHPESLADDPSAERCIVSVYGADHPGIVSAVTRVLAERSVNIVDLSSRRVGDPAVYVLGIDAELPDTLDLDGLLAALAPVAHAESVNVAVEAVGDDLI